MAETCTDGGQCMFPPLKIPTFSKSPHLGITIFTYHENLNPSVASATKQEQPLNRPIMGVAIAGINAWARIIVRGFHGLGMNLKTALERVPSCMPSHAFGTHDPLPISLPISTCIGAH